MHPVFRALRHRNYALFFFGQGVSLIGTWMQQTGEVWLAYRLTGSATSLGVVGFASQIPIFLLAPVAGAWIDRANKHRVLVFTQTAAMGLSFFMAYQVYTHQMSYGQLIIVSVLSGLIDAVEIPTRQSFVIQMVEDPVDLPNAIALNSSLVNGARLLGPSFAGLLIAAVGEAGCFFINGLSFIAVLIALAVMHLQPVSPSNLTTRLQDVLGEGLSYIFHSTPIRMLLGLLATVSLTGSACTVLLPLFATAVLSGDARTLGFLMTFQGLGALAAALLLASRRSVIGLGRVIVRGVLLVGSALLLFSVSKITALAFGCASLLGFGMMSASASINTVLQTIVDNDKRGRVMSFFTMAFIGMAPLGNLLGGFVADHWGVRWTVATAGALCACAGLLFRMWLPLFRSHVRPIYQRLGILPEVAIGLQASTTSTRRPPG